MLELILVICFLIGGFFLLGVVWLYFQKGKNFFENREKRRPYECGFDPKENSRLPFSLRFFLLLIFFLVFDIELVLLLELPLVYKQLFFKLSLMILVFIFILYTGLLEEWRRGALR